MEPVIRILIGIHAEFQYLHTGKSVSLSFLPCTPSVEGIGRSPMKAYAEVIGIFLPGFPPPPPPPPPPPLGVKFVLEAICGSVSGLPVSALPA